MTVDTYQLRVASGLPTGAIRLPRVMVAGDIEVLVDEQDCPSHIARADDPKVCRRCGVHVDELRPLDDEDDAP